MGNALATNVEPSQSGTKKQQTANQQLAFLLERTRRLKWVDITQQAVGGQDTLPAPRNSQGTCTHGSVMYVYGGRSPQGRLNDLWAFDTDTRAWRCLERSDDPRGPMIRSGCLLVHDGMHSLYVGFGYDSEPVAHNDMYRYDLYERQWTLLRPHGVLPPARINFRGWYYNGGVWIFGGSPDGTVCFGDLWRYDTASNTWTQPITHGTPPPACQWSAVDVWRESRVVVFGGHYDTGLPARTFHVFDCETMMWESLITDHDPVIRGQGEVDGEDGVVAAAITAEGDVEEVAQGALHQLEALQQRIQLQEQEDDDDGDVDDGNEEDEAVYTTWEQLMCSSPASALKDDTLVLWGGWDGRIHRSCMWSVDLATGVWQRVRPSESAFPPPQPKGSASAILSHDTLFLFGGWNGWTQTNNMHAVSFAFPSLQRLCLEVISRERSRFPDDLDLSRFEALLSPTSFST